MNVRTYVARSHFSFFIFHFTFYIRTPCDKLHPITSYRALLRPTTPYCVLPQGEAGYSKIRTLFELLSDDPIIQVWVCSSTPNKHARQLYYY